MCPALSAVHVVRYENGDPNSVRVVPWNWTDYESRAIDYNERDFARLQRDSFVVQHTDLIRREPTMEDEFDHQGYWDHHRRHGRQIVWKSGKQKRTWLDVEVCDSDSESSSTESTDTFIDREDLIQAKQPSESFQKKWDNYWRQRWDDFPLLCGKDQKRLLSNINETLPNLGRVSCTFVFLINGRRIEMHTEGSGCIISDDGRFVLTAGHVVDSLFDKKDIVEKIHVQFPKSEVEKCIRIVEDRAIDDKLYQYKNEKLLNHHTFYRCHKFEREGKSNCEDEIKVKAVHADPRYAEALTELAGKQSFFQKAWNAVFATSTSPQQQMERFDFGILELECAPEHLEQLDKLAFGMITHVTEQEQMQRFVSETKVGLWGYSSDKNIAETAKKGTIYDDKVDCDEVKVCDESVTKPLIRRCWGHSEQIFYDPDQMKDFNVLMSLTDSWQGISGSPLWFMSNEQQSESKGDDLMYLEPETRRRIIGGVASCSAMGQYYLTGQYIASKRHKRRLCERKTRVGLDQAAVFDNEAVEWIERVTGQKCHRAKYDVTGKTTWSKGSFNQKK